MNTFKIVSFDAFYDEFMNNLNEKVAVHSTICEIFRGFTQDTLVLLYKS